MQFELSEEQQELKEFLRELLSVRASSTEVRTSIAADAPYDAELWSILCDQIGAASLAIPEEYGGSGFSVSETHLVLQELGRALAPSPYLGSVAITASAILASGDSEACESLLPEIASGERIAALAWADPSGSWNPAGTSLTARAESDGWRLDGSIDFVLDGAYADDLLAIAQTPTGPALFAVADPADVERTATPSLDQTIHLATLRFEGAAARLLTGDPEALEKIRLHALTAIAALQLGTADRALDDTVEYSLQRSQFGRQIGSYQALKHRMADLHVLIEKMRTTSAAATWAAATEDPDWPALAILAKATASDALSTVAGEMIQLHGGIAITWEHDAHLVFKRAHATAQLFGTAGRLRAERAVSLGLVP